MNRYLLMLCCGSALVLGWIGATSGRSAAERGTGLPRTAVRATSPGSSPGPADLPLLIADPSPEALVLLAARVSSLGPDEIVERLHGFDRYARQSERLVAAAMIERLVALDPERALQAGSSFRALGELFAESL